MARDITEGRGSSTPNIGRAIAVDIGLNATAIWQNTGNSFDCAIAGIPFLTAIKDERPYERATAPFRKQQFDSQRDPGEQSLSTWWLRSQSSFHAGEGILFYDPLANPYSTTIASNSYRVKSSYGVDIWKQGQVTLLHETNKGHITTAPIDANTRPAQTMRSITWSGTDGYLLHDGYDIDRIAADGTVDHWVDYSITDDPIYALCDDGNYAYWVTNDVKNGKLDMRKKALSASSASTSTSMFTKTGITVTRAAMEYVKQRIVMAVNNVIYEVQTNASTSTSMTTVYTHPNTGYIFTSIAESGTAVYVAGFNGVQSSIYKFTLDTTTGAMPTLTSAITAAELPVGEKVFKIYEYLGYLCIGTSKGIRVASIGTDGSLTYGPLLVETTNPCYDFAARDRFVWCATGVDSEPGVIRIDLSNEIESLRFAYAHDIHYDLYTLNVPHITTACAFIGATAQLAFCIAAVTVGTQITNKALSGGVITLATSSAHSLNVGDIVYIEGVGSPFDTTDYVGNTIASTPSTTTFTVTSASTATVASTAVSTSTAIVKVIGNTYAEHATNLREDGYIETGLIRYNTLEPKNFKRIISRGNFDHGSLTIQVRDINGVLYDLITYDALIGSPEVTITQPQGAQDAIGLRFVISRDSASATEGPTFKGYQLKAVPATPRSRLISIPLMNFDTETDKYNSTIGYEGRAIERLAALENAESAGDVVTWQDFRTGELAQCLIEEVKFTDITPPDKRLTGYGGIITLTIRTV